MKTTNNFYVMPDEFCKIKTGDYNPLADLNVDENIFNLKQIKIWTINNDYYEELYLLPNHFRGRVQN